MNKINILFISLFSLLLFAQCDSGADDGAYNGDEEQGVELPMLDIDNLREAPFKIGGAISVSTLKSDEHYRNLVVEHYNSVTPENEMKMVSLSTGNGTYNFTDADYLCDFAAENDMRVHGHVLLWYYATPSWVSSFVGDRNDWLALMRTYITDVVTHFKDKGVTSWDVVNEALLDDGTYRSSVWYDNIGEDYIKYAFLYAAAADPDALLFYNDYGHEYSYVKLAAINNLVDELVDAGIPIHGIGLQMHTDIEKSENQIKYAVRTAAYRNLQVHISEFDVSVNPDAETSLTFTDSLSLSQQTTYRWAAEAMMECDEELRYGITFWGVSDQYSWRYEDDTDWVLPFSNDYQKKDAYYGLLQGMYQ